MDTDITISVKEAMNTDLKTVGPDASSYDAARTLKKNNIGCLIIVEKGAPIGIVSERDICYRVVAANKMPKDVKIKEIMSSPLVTIDSRKTITDASELMVKKNIRRLPVVEKGKLVGIITAKNILQISPKMIEILKEVSRINSEGYGNVQPALDRGTCEICNDQMVPIYEVDGVYVCESCMEDMSGEE